MPDTAYTVIKNFILAKLQAVTQLQQVTDNPELNFNGYPAAIIIPAEGESDWETNMEDQRNYAFDVIIYEETKKQGISTAINTLMDTVDYVLDTFAQDKLLIGIQALLPAGHTFLTVNPVAAGWGDIPDKEVLAATVKLTCRLSIDNS